ncbi:MAG TPA: ferrous iron transport protein B [Mobilitalea sp.]|nr:ferrous iron transport protein B [Mobilitalea sp.]
MKAELQVGFVGNPNCGKTTLFNAYTGANLKVANWPGVTVEKKEGSYKYQNNKLKLADLPGIYSLTSYTMEEKLTREFILDSNVDVIVNIVDASSLERNLYLTLQLIELGKPVVLALNMMDIVEERGMKIDLKQLSELLGIPVVPVSARRKTGLDSLMHTIVSYKDKTVSRKSDIHPVKVMKMGVGSQAGKPINTPLVYSNNIEVKIDEVAELINKQYGIIDNIRWYAMKLMEKDEAVLNKYPINLHRVVAMSYEEEIINEKYDFIENVIDKVLVNKSVKSASTDKVDRILTNRYLGLPIFLCIMAFVFFLTFVVGNAIKGLFQSVLTLLSAGTLHLLTSIGAGRFVTSLVVDGIISGVGGILTFLPNIFILFLALAYLEDSGYMSRVAYVMDGIMGKLGLSGRSFIPMLLGFGCTVPAIMASRSLENMEDRRRTILITPFMSCSARLPIYVLFSGMFFGKYAMLVAFSMYLIGIIVAITVAFFLHNNSEKKPCNTLLIELPEYKSPNVRTIIIYVWEKVKEYLTKAGTTIFAASVVMWFILNFGPGGMVTDMSQSFGAMIGKAVAPVLSIAGLGMWQVVLALISGVAAKEVVVSSFSVLFQVNNITSPQGMKSMVDILAGYGFGALNAYSLMVFSLLYIPCVATIGVIQREMRSTKWTIFTILFQLGIALLVSTLVYQVGRLFLG